MSSQPTPRAPQLADRLAAPFLRFLAIERWGAWNELAGHAHGITIHAQSGFPTSLTLIVAVLLLIVGALAISSMAFNVGPFG